MYNIMDVLKISILAVNWGKEICYLVTYTSYSDSRTVSHQNDHVRHIG